MKLFNFIKSLFKSKQIKQVHRFPYLFYFASDVHIRACIAAPDVTEPFYTKAAAKCFTAVAYSFKAWAEQDLHKFMSIVSDISRAQFRIPQELDILENRILGWHVTFGPIENRLVFWNHVRDFLYIDEGRQTIARYQKASLVEKIGVKAQQRYIERANFLFEATKKIVNAANQYLDVGHDKESKVYLIQTTGTAAGQAFKTVQLSEPFAPKINLSEIPISGICFMTLDHCSKLTY